MIKNIALIITIAVILSSCFSRQEVPKETLVIPILPIVLGYDNTVNHSVEDIEALSVAKFIFFRDFNVYLDYKEIYYSDSYIPIYQCNAVEMWMLDSVNIDAQLKNRCYYPIVIFFEYNKFTDLSLLGCSPLKGLEDPPAKMWIYLNGNPLMDQFVLLHELAHMFGAEHTDDHSLMNPYLSQTENWDFNEETREAILKYLEKYRKK
jgi:hypothetical protein